MSSSLFSQAQWIMSPAVGAPQCSAPVPFFRKPFSLPRQVKSAQLAISALGVYECEINGVRVGEDIFAPGWTDYRKTVTYRTYDVTSLLQAGANVIAAVLGDGWYCGYVAWKGRQMYGERPELLAQLSVVFDDGSTAVIATDSTWKTATGPILESDFLMGETYDARLDLPEWSIAKYDDSAWTPVLPGKGAPGAELMAHPGVPVRRIEELKPVKQQELDGWPLKSQIFDFGQNFTGRVRIKLQAPRGTTVRLRFAEIVMPDGKPYLRNLRSARATDHYTCKGGGVETWEPRFTFHGFRHVEITGMAPQELLEVTGVVLHSEMPPTGTFRCSHELLNQLQHNIIWGQKSNLVEVPTDCPQRDERLGWTGDAQVFVRTAAFNMDVRAFFHKWMRDVRDAQQENGGVPCVCPSIDFAKLEAGTPGEDGGPAWADAAIICPWTIYLCYGDRQILEDHYTAMERFMRFMLESRSRNFIRSHPEVDPWGGFGDWLALDGSGKTEGGTPKELIGTAFLAYDAEIMAKTAAVLGKPDDAQRYRKLREEVAQAFRRRYVTPEGLMAGGTQTSYVLALHFRLLEEGQRATAAKELVRDIERRKYHLATGFVGTPYLLEVLEEAGYLDVAYKLLEQETFPSWLFPVKNGATTIWERWDGWTPEKGFQDEGMNSFNHYAYGAVGAWMYRSVAGLELDENEPGYRKILFRPRPGGTLTWAEARLQTAHGPVGIRWERRGGEIEVSVEVPPNCGANFSAPEGFVSPVATLESGKHQFTLKRA